MIYMLPIGQGLQSNGQFPLHPETVLPLSVIGDVRPSVYYARISGMTRAIFPDGKTGRMPVTAGPLRSSSG